jgi:spore coat polysaccharide biosynthesis protein SpsF
MYKDKKVVATIEARMTSSRLPGKVLMNLCEKPALQHIIERMKNSKYIDEVVVATTVNSTDNPIVYLCDEIGCKVFRGSEDDVLKRVLDAAKFANADIIVEITGDCPVIDSSYADYLIEKLVDGNYDYASNIIKRSFPDGYDIQVFYTSILEKVNVLTDDIADHEHVSLYIYRHPEIFKLYNLCAPDMLNFPEYEITLDTKEDYELIKKIYEKLYPINNFFGCQEVVDFLNQNRELLDILKNVKRTQI